MADVFYQSSYGGVRLWFANISTSAGRTQIVHELSRGDVHPTQDRGLVNKVARGTLLFDDMAGENKSPLERFREFEELVNGGKPQLFTHPLLGSYLARVGEFDHEVNDSGIISASVEFIPAEEIRPVQPATAGTSPVAGETAVHAQCDVVDAELADVGLETDLTNRARTATTAWAEAVDLPARQVFVDVGELADRVGQTIDEMEMEDDIVMWSSYRSLVVLADTIRSAGEAATSEVASLFTLRVFEPISLRALVARIYGGAEADDRYRQALSINDIRTPGWIAPGTELRMPQPAPQSRRA